MTIRFPQSLVPVWFQQGKSWTRTNSDMSRFIEEWGTVQWYWIICTLLPCALENKSSDGHFIMQLTFIPMPGREKQSQWKMERKWLPSIIQMAIYALPMICSAQHGILWGSDFLYYDGNLIFSLERPYCLRMAIDYSDLCIQKVWRHSDMLLTNDIRVTCITIQLYTPRKTGSKRVIQLSP